METLRIALKEVEAEREQVKGQLESLTERDSALAQVESGLRTLLGEEDPSPSTMFTPSGSYPRTGEAVRNWLEGHPRKRFTARGLVRVLKEGNLLDPKLRSPYGSVLEAAKRLARTHPHIYRVNQGAKAFFVYRPPKGAAE